MTSKEFVIWMQGFVEACNDYSPLPKQWDTLKDKLGEVKDEPMVSFPTFTPNTAPMDNPYKITCIPSGTITTTPGVGSISIASGIGLGSSSTTYVNPQSGSWHYTYYTSTLQGVTGSNGPDYSGLNGVQLDKENQLELEFESK